ncbi:Carbohydrate ABC transporter permease OS=Streptomyces alboniger OX=132473 GN=CP975_12575 PE=3 SV=1 [Streptomyces alboniger]
MKADTVDPKADRPEVPPTDRVPAKPGRGRPLGQKAWLDDARGPSRTPSWRVHGRLARAADLDGDRGLAHQRPALAQTPPPLWFGGNLFKNLERAWTEASLGDAMLNTTIVAGSITIGTVLFSTVAGFAFAKLKFRFSGALLLLTIGTMMVPPQLSVVPLYLWIADLQWTNQLQAVILPTFVSAFGVFFMRQYLLQALPGELIEASTSRTVWAPRPCAPSCPPAPASR